MNKVKENNKGFKITGKVIMRVISLVLVAVTLLSLVAAIFMY